MTGQINLSPSHGLAVGSARSRLPAPARRELPKCVPLPGEEVAAVRHAESFLIDFCGAEFEAVPWALRPAAVKYAIGHLVTVALHNESVAELFLEPIAAAAGVTKTGLRKQVEDRCWFYSNFPKLHADKTTRQQATTEFERMVA